MSKNKKKKIIIISISLIILLITVSVAFGRYIYDFAKNYYLESRGFYFNSSTMSSLGTSHNINNWDGVNPYQITIDLNSKKNDYLKTDYDITYDINIECSENISCVLSKTNGTIYESISVDSYTITIYPLTIISSEDIATITTSATSNYPYTKTLSTTYSVGIETFGFNYHLEDSEGSKYALLELTNSYPYYKVTEAFASYSVGDLIGYENYKLLSQIEKDKCVSAIVTLSININKVRIDIVDETYQKRSFNVSTASSTIDNQNYVNSLKFKMDANSTIKIKFYKLDITNNYSLNDILSVSVDTIG